MFTTESLSLRRAPVETAAVTGELRSLLRVELDLYADVEYECAASPPVARADGAS